MNSTPHTPKYVALPISSLGFAEQELLEELGAPGSEAFPGRDASGAHRGASCDSGTLSGCGWLSFTASAAVCALRDHPGPSLSSATCPVLGPVPVVGPAGLVAQGCSLDTRFLLGVWQLSPSPTASRDCIVLHDFLPLGTGSPRRRERQPGTQEVLWACCAIGTMDRP